MTGDLEPEKSETIDASKTGIKPSIPERTTIDEFTATEQAAGGRAAYERAKAAGQTKLTYGQWVQVRTPSFKNWFGDWQALRAQTRLDAMKPLQVKVPPEWRGLSAAELRERVADALDAMVRSQTTIMHPELGEIRVGRAGQRKTVSEGRDPAKLLIAADLKSVLPASVLAGSTPSRDREGVAFAKLLARVKLDDVGLVATLTVRQQPDGNWYYNTVALEEGRPEGSNREPGLRPEHPPMTGLSEYYRKRLDRVNPDTVSKVVDAQTGEPLVVYHGTNADFSVFDRSKSGNGPSKFGFWMTPQADFGEMFGSTLMPVYLSMSNPHRITSEQWDAIRDKHAKDGEWFASWRDELIAKGRDGLIVAGRKFTTSRGLQMNDPDVMAVFRPEQIKSAIGNRGTFDPANPDIRFSRRQNTIASGQLPQIDPADQSPWQRQWAKVDTLTAPDALDNILYEMQDKLVDLKRLREHIDEIGGTISRPLKNPPTPAQHVISYASG